FASGALPMVTSSNVTVGPAAASRLTILSQPSANAIAGTAFAAQPVVRVEDAFGNLRTTDNSTVVTATRSAGNGTLQGVTNLTAAAGVVTFTNLSHNVATNTTIAFNSSGLTGTSSSVVAVGPAAFVKLQLLAPGETNTPGTATGKSGTPVAQTAGTAFNVTAN